MAEEKDILQYDLKLNIGEVEAKIQRVQELQAALSAKKLAGEDTSALEQQLGAELAGLGKLGAATHQASGATADLVKNKEKLAAVANLVGAQLGPLVGQLGSVVALITTMGPQLAVIAGGLALVAAGKKAFDDLAQGAEKAAAAQERYNDAVRKQRGERVDVAAGVAAELEKSGARTPEAVAGGLAATAALQKEYGLAPQKTARIAALGQVAGITGTEDLAVLAMMEQQGAQFPAAEAMRAALEAGQARGDYPTYLAQARAQAADVVGRRERAKALMPGARGAAEIDAGAIAFEQLKGAGKIPEDVTEEEFRNWRAELAAMRARGPRKVWGKEAKRLTRLEQLEGELGWTEPYIEQIGRMEAGGPEIGAQERRAGQTTIQYYTNNIATQYNASNKKTSPFHDSTFSPSGSAKFVKGRY